jgi:hypothetical protein
MSRLVVLAMLALSAPAADVPALLRAFDAMAAHPPWPGFEPGSTPVAVYDGARTWLRRHPSPPGGFDAVASTQGLFVFDGLYPALRANTSAEIGGVLTATVMNADSAAVLMHECFHVYQRQHHPSWQANEAALFTYPVEDAGNAALATLEALALRRALSSPDASCWAARAAQTRRERFARLPADAVAYERGTELNEGLAQYIQDRSAGHDPDLSRAFGPADVRARAYVVGEAIALVLDRDGAAWKERVAGSLDELLPATAKPLCDYTAAERAVALEHASVAVKELLVRRGERLSAFEHAPGWRVTVLAAQDRPLELRGFDPMNVENLGEGRVLHGRMVQLGNQNGGGDVLDHESLTAGAGSHPLFQGVRSWTILLVAEPGIKLQDRNVEVTAPGLRLNFRRADVETRGQAIVIRLT